MYWSNIPLIVLLGLELSLASSSEDAAEPLSTSSLSNMGVVWRYWWERGAKVVMSDGSRASLESGFALEPCQLVDVQKTFMNSSPPPLGSIWAIWDEFDRKVTVKFTERL